MKVMRILLLVPAALLTALLAAPAAGAHESPAGCDGSGLRVGFSPTTLVSLKGFHRDGDHLELAVRVENQATAAPCDVTGLTIQVGLPSADGGVGESVKVADRIDLPAGSPPRDLAAVVPYDVALEQDVFAAPVSLSYVAEVHSGAPDRTEERTLEEQIRVTRPRASLTVSPDRVFGAPPLEVRYEYALTNLSPAPSDGSTAPAMIPTGGDGHAALADSNCDRVRYESGDSAASGTPGRLDPGETWRFACTRILDSPGTFFSRPSIVGIADSDWLPWPQTAADAEVTVLGPDLRIEKSHRGDLLAGGSGEYRLVVTNVGNRATSGRVGLADLLPPGLTATAISGEGWACELRALACSRSDPLGSGDSFPPVRVAVVAGANPPGSVINTATVEGGGEPTGASSDNYAIDPTTIRSPVQPNPAASRNVRVRSVRARNNGSVVIKVMVPSAGRITIDDAGKRNLVRRTRRHAKRAGTYRLTVKANRNLRRRLNRGKHTRRVSVKIRFKPHSGHAQRINQKVRFRLR